MLPGKSGKLLNKDFWKGKNVLVTGHTGFKGSWICQLLVELDAKVMGLSLENPVSDPCLFDILKLNSRVIDYRGDITNLNTCFEIINKLNPDILIHMAAQSLVRISYYNPVKTFNTNIMGTVNILEAVRNNSSLGTVLIVSSDKCYKNIENQNPYNEENSLGGDDPYSSSKACTEHISLSYYKSYLKIKDVGLATARAGNVIGGGDWSNDRLIPDLVQAWVKDQHLIIRSPNAIRPWQHVLEPICGYLRLIEFLYYDKDKFSGGWNFGPDLDDTKSVLDTVKLCQKMWNGKPKVKIQENNSMHEATILRLDNRKVKKHLKINPKMSFEQSLNKTILWYEKYYNEMNISHFTSQQIHDYILI